MSLATEPGLVGPDDATVAEVEAGGTRSVRALLRFRTLGLFGAFMARAGTEFSYLADNLRALGFIRIPPGVQSVGLQGVIMSLRDA